MDVLELGDGPGVAGLLAAACGHRVTITQMNTLALDFVHAHALLNDFPAVRVRPLDWRNPDLGERFDLILSSDAMPGMAGFERLAPMLGRLIKPRGTVLMSTPPRSGMKSFLRKIAAGFRWTERPVALKGVGEAHQVMLYTLRPVAAANGARSSR
jgi:2-polyprenyl-3-methyl-5-hydroxy-6-metoxy-1,4-benzoquinol methylase